MDRTGFLELINKHDREYVPLCRDLSASIGADRLSQISKYEYCELESSFLGFIHIYKAVADFLPKNYTVIDFGCYQALQADYFKDYHRYIGVDCFTPPEYRLPQNNAEYYDMTIQTFCKGNVSKLDLNRCFAICSAVEDFKATDMVSEMFPKHVVWYPGKEIKFGWNKKEIER